MYLYIGSMLFSESRGNDIPQVHHVVKCLLEHQLSILWDSKEVFDDRQ